ncbi:MAG TPA: RodZ domain-containing protein [Candidatus Limnocylindria bacterium]
MKEPEGHKLGEVLRSAREERGVDLARVERDTKIRSRYLSALERGAYRDLPGAVYTKGFLRNYGAYLGLDTEYLVDLYRLESAAAASERPTVQAPPRPIATRRRGAFVITPGAVAAAVLTVGVSLFIVYLVSEFVTFAGTPDLRVTTPLGDVSGWGGDDYTFAGVTEPNARVTAETATRKTEATADADGSFEIVVALRPGSNVVTLTANDPLTGRDSEPVTRTILVGDAPSAAPSVPGDVLALSAPEADATLEGPVEITGTGPAGATVTVTARATGRAPATFRVTNLAGEEIELPNGPPRAPEPLALEVAADGTFRGTLDLASAAWTLQLTLDDGPDEPIERAITVTAAAGLRGVLRVVGAASYLEIDEDGEPKANVSGRVAEAGSRISLRADTTLRIRVGNAGAIRLVINGVNLGPMGGQGDVIEWQVRRR